MENSFQVFAIARPVIRIKGGGVSVGEIFSRYAEALYFEKWGYVDFVAQWLDESFPVVF